MLHKQGITIRLYKSDDGPKSDGIKATNVSSPSQNLRSSAPAASNRGLRLTHQRRFDFFIFDLYINFDGRLPGRSGVELCRAIRELDQQAPILFCSAAVYVRAIREAMRAGAQARLVKPVIPGELKAKRSRRIESAGA